ncbi:MAG: helix-turn-helix domain-containing protein [Solirubrobacterales bacterium]
MIALGKAISELRKEQGLRQEDLARRVDLHESYISFIESGRRNPTWLTILKISQGLETAPADLVQRAEGPKRKR